MATLVDHSRRQLKIPPSCFPLTKCMRLCMLTIFSSWYIVRHISYFSIEMPSSLFLAKILQILIFHQNYKQQKSVYSAHNFHHSELRAWWNTAASGPLCFPQQPPEQCNLSQEWWWNTAATWECEASKHVFVHHYNAQHVTSKALRQNFPQLEAKCWRCHTPLSSTTTQQRRGRTGSWYNCEHACSIYETDITRIFKKNGKVYLKDSFEFVLRVSRRFQNCICFVFLQNFWQCVSEWNSSKSSQL